MQERPRRFVVLFHEQHPADTDHFDLMIESGGSLMTWRVESAPELTTQGAACRRIADHRIDYLTYEGPISGNRGRVRRHDSGTCLLSDVTDDEIRMRFEGEKLNGDYTLRRYATERDHWRLELA